MSRVIIAVIVGAAAAMGLGAGLPYYTGVVAEREFHRGFEQVQDGPYVSMRPTSYSRGWLGAEARSELTLHAEDESLIIPVEHVIEHHLISAEMISTVRVPPQVSDAAGDLFEDGVLTAVTTVYANGDQHSVITAPPVRTDPGAALHVDWSGFDGTVDLKGERLTVDFRMPHLRVGYEDNAMGLEGVSLTGDLKQFAPAVWLGDSLLEVASFSVTALDPDAGQPIDFHVAGIELGQILHETGPDLFGADLAFHVAELTVEPQTVLTDIAWETEVRNIDRRAYLDFLQALPAVSEPGAAPEEINDQAAQIIMALAPDFLARSPQVHVKQLGVTDSAGDTFHATLDVSFDGDGSVRMIEHELLARLSLEGRARMPQSMLDGILTRTAMANAQSIAEHYAEVTEEDVASLADEIKGAQLQQAEMAGLLVAEGDDYRFDLSFRQGTLVINGRPMDALLGL